MSLASILQGVQKGFLKDILTGAGVSLVTSSAVYLAFQAAVNELKQATYGIAGDILMILHISGFDIFMSSILAALATYLTISATRLSLEKVR